MPVGTNLRSSIHTMVVSSLQPNLKDKSEGMHHECTISRITKQNGMAERLNQSLVENVRSMLIESKLPHKFWVEALCTTTYLRNQSPTKVIERMTPHEAWAKEKSQVGHSCVFAVTPMLISQKMRSKSLIQNEEPKCIFLGYDHQTKRY